MIHRFGDSEIDESRRELRRDGVVRVVEPRVFDLIVYLVRNRERVVSKRELLDALWPDEDVFESALTVAIHRARKALGGAPRSRGSAPTIATLSRRGYRFVFGPEEIRPISTMAVQTPAAAPADELVGRHAERLVIRDALRSALEKRPRIVMFRGEPGIGKTRLLEETARSAHAEGSDVLWAQAEGRDGPSFSLWRQILAAFAARGTVSELRSRLGPATATLAPLLPTWSGRAGQLPELPSVPSADSRVLYEAIAAALRALASGPLVLLLDDLQDADDESLRTLEHVVSRANGLPILIAAAARDRWSTGHVDVLLRHSASRRRKVYVEQELGPLSDQDVRLLLDNAAGAAVPDVVAATVLRRAAGNPLFAGQYWRYLVAQRLVLREGDGWTTRVGDDVIGLPSSVRSIVRERCSSLSAAARDVLTVIALFEGEPSFAEIAEASSLPSEEVAEILERGVDARVLRSGLTPDRYRLAHPTFVQFLREDLAFEVRQALHRRIADALEHLYGGEDDAHLRPLAHHASLGANGETAERAIRLAQRLARSCSAKLDLVEAARWLERAIRLIEVHRPEQVTRRFGLLFNLGDAYLRAGQEQEARRAFAEAASAGAARFASVGAREPRTLEYGAHSSDRLLTMIRAGLHLVGQDSTATPSWREESGEWEKATRGAEARARRSGDVMQLASALVSRRWRAGVEARPQEQLRLSTEAVLLAELAGDPTLLLEARLLRIHDLLEHGRIAECEREMDSFTELAAELEIPVYRWCAAYLRVTRAQLHGQLAEAERLAPLALQTADLSFADVAAPFMGTQLVGIRAYQGRMGEVVGLLESFVATYPEQPIGHANLASVYCELGRTEDARLALERALAARAHMGPFAAALDRQVAAALARPCTHLRRPDVARAQYDVLAAWRGTFLVASLAVAWNGPVDAYLALLAESAGRWRIAYALYRSAIEACERTGNRAIEAHVRYELARALLGRGARERRQAGCLLDRAAEIADELQLDGLARWTSDLREGSPAERSRTGFPDG